MQGIRIARAYTGRDKIAKFEGGYHGWHDYGLWSSHFDLAFDSDLVGPADHPSSVPDSAGIPEVIKDTVLVLPYEENAFAMIEEHADELAAVMIEPVIGGWTLPGDKGFLERLREVTKRRGVLLFFDEVITGFRLALGGAQEYYGVVPDVVTYGKLIGGGLPVGAVGTSAAILEAVTAMEPPILVGGTFNGNPMTLAAGNAVLRFLMEHPETYPQLAARGDHLRSRVNEFARAKGLPAIMTGLCSLFQTHLTAPPVVKPRDLAAQDFEALRDFQLFLRYNGLFIPRIHLAFLSTAHTDEDVEKAITAHQVSLEACLAADHIE
jgi:glutamate-1-semialdehyde 2,1-aminomutase